MIQMTTTEVVVTGYRSMQRDGKPVARKDGTVVEFCTYRAPDGNGQDRDFETLLDPGINGSRPDVGSVVVVRIQRQMEPKPATARDGRAYVAWRPKDTITAFHEATAAKPR